MKQLETAVLIIAFNRLETTTKVLQSLTKIRPKKLYLSLDGPRENNYKDIDNQRDILNIFEKIDWECELKIKQHKKNLGCKYGPAEAINWFFECEDEGIILEDDIVANETFFSYCEELLEKYRNNEAVGLICGTNFSKAEICESYTFSYFNHIWGWATWKRAWKKNDLEMDRWTRSNQSSVSKVFPDIRSINFWTYHFDKAHANKIDAWDYQWLHSCWENEMLAILPKHSLVKNIGFGTDATHTKNIPEFARGDSTVELDFPLKHPEYIIQNKIVDKKITDDVFKINWTNIFCNYVKRKLIEKF